MTIDFHLRPPIQDMSLHLFRRPLHPELFQRLAVRRICRADWRLELWLTVSGHVISWMGPGGHLTEVAAATEELPECGRLLRHRLEGNRSAWVGGPKGVQYQVSFQVERLTREPFFRFHDELRSGTGHDALVFIEETNHRLSFSPLRAVQWETRPRWISVFTFHTFPDELAVVKIQSLIEF
ncbi:MAG: DUF2617 family protein [Gemmataceae bacterium]|nr:DUF2617 family protein [Gemmataceae bacterium]